MLYFDKDTKKMRMIVKDTGSFAIRLSNYVLDDGDKIIFTVNTEKEKQNPVIQKTITSF